MKFEIYHGDCIEQLKKLPENSIDTCITSPPYYGLRDYGTATWVGGDPNCKHYRQTKITDSNTTGHHSMSKQDQAVGDAIYKTVCPLCGAVRVDKQIGLEETPEQYVDKMVAVFREVRRVLKNDGTLWLNLGDSYAGSGKGRNSDGTVSNSVVGTKQETNRGATSGVLFKSGYGDSKPKDLIGIPWMVAFALKTDGWWLRQDIIFSKANPMPESVKDRCTKSHEYIFLLSKSPKYYFDYEAIEEPANYDGRNDTMLKGSQKYANSEYLPNQNRQSFASGKHERWKFKSGIKFGGNKYGSSQDNHFQTYSGQEWIPKYKNLAYDGQRPNTFHINRANGIDDTLYAVRRKRDVWTVSLEPTPEAHFATFPKKLVEPCVLAGCREGGVVLDPFSGSGTTGMVAIMNNRNYIGIELNEKYIDITKHRISNECDMAIDDWHNSNGVTWCNANIYKSYDVWEELE